MRVTMAIIAALAFTILVFAQDRVTDDPAVVKARIRLQTVRDSVNAIGAAETKVWADSVVIADTLLVRGVTFVADPKDASWIQIDVPLSTSTGFENAFWLAKLAEAKNEFGAKPSGVMGRVRMRRDRAIEFQRSIKQDLP